MSPKKTNKTKSKKEWSFKDRTLQTEVLAIFKYLVDHYNELSYNEALLLVERIRNLSSLLDEPWLKESSARIIDAADTIIEKFVW